MDCVSVPLLFSPRLNLAFPGAESVTGLTVLQAFRKLREAETWVKGDETRDYCTTEDRSIQRRRRCQIFVSDFKKIKRTIDV